MKANVLTQPSVPVLYGLLHIQHAIEHGVNREALLHGLNISAEQLQDPDTRLSLAQIHRLIYRSLHMSGDYGLGYEFGLKTSLCAHGLLGFGVLSQRTVRDAIRFGLENIKLRTVAFQAQLLIEDDYAVIDIKECFPLTSPLREYAFDLALVALWRMSVPLFEGAARGIELWFNYPEPAYYQRYQDRLPSMHFNESANQLRFPATLLDHIIDAGNPVAAQLLQEQCQRELALQDNSHDISDRVLAMLSAQNGAYPDLKSISAQLCMSERTVRRKLEQRGRSFVQMRDAVRQTDAINFLRNTAMTVEKISLKLGYADAANFIHAFQKWTGTTPGAYRKNSTDQKQTISRVSQATN